MSTRYPIPLREGARMLGLGPNKLFRALRERRVLDRNNMPYRCYVQQGLFTTKLKGFEHQAIGSSTSRSSKSRPTRAQATNRQEPVHEYSDRHYSKD